MEDQKRRDVYLEAHARYSKDSKIRIDELAWHCAFQIWQEIDQYMGLPWIGGENPTKRRMEFECDRQVKRNAGQFSPQPPVRQEKTLAKHARPVPSTNLPAPSSSSAARPHTSTSPSPQNGPQTKDEPCANCGKTDHKLIICMGPLTNGCIQGCPLHNIKSHNLDECQHPLAVNLKQRLYYLFKARNGRPPLQIKEAWIDIHQGEYFGWPWTPAFAEKNKDFWKTYDYGGYKAHTGMAPVLADPSWHDGSWKRYLTLAMPTGPLTGLNTPKPKRAREDGDQASSKRVRKEESCLESPWSSSLDSLTIQSAFELQYLIDSKHHYSRAIDLTARIMLSQITKRFPVDKPQNLDFRPVDHREISGRLDMVLLGVEKALFATLPSRILGLETEMVTKDSELKRRQSTIDRLEKELKLSLAKVKLLSRREQKAEGDGI